MQPGTWGYEQSALALRLLLFIMSSATKTAIKTYSNSSFHMLPQLLFVSLPCLCMPMLVAYTGGASATTTTAGTHSSFPAPTASSVSDAHNKRYRCHERKKRRGIIFLAQLEMISGCSMK